MKPEIARLAETGDHFAVRHGLLQGRYRIVGNLPHGYVFRRFGSRSAGGRGAGLPGRVQVLRRQRIRTFDHRHRIGFLSLLLLFQLFSQLGDLPLQLFDARVLSRFVIKTVHLARHIFIRLPGFFDVVLRGRLPPVRFAVGDSVQPNRCICRIARLFLRLTPELHPVDRAGFGTFGNFHFPGGQCGIESFVRLLLLPTAVNQIHENQKRNRQYAGDKYGFTFLLRFGGGFFSLGFLLFFRLIFLWHDYRFKGSMFPKSAQLPPPHTPLTM